MSILWLIVGLVLIVTLYMGVKRLARSKQKKAALPDEADAAEPAESSAPEPVSAPEPPPEFETRLTGDVNVGGRSSFPGNVLVHGNLNVEDESVLEGFAEVHGNAVLGSRARVTRPLIVHGSLEIGPDTTLEGARVDGDVILRRGAVVDGPLECGALHLEDEDPADKTWAPEVSLPSVEAP